MNSNKWNTQVNGSGVVETGRRRRWSDDEKLRLPSRPCRRPERYRRQRAAAAIGIVCNSPRGHSVTPNNDLLKIQFEINLQSAFGGKTTEPCRAVIRGRLDSSDA